MTLVLAAPVSSFGLFVVGTIRRDDRDGIEFRVTDTGIGILPEQLEHVFDRFRQGEASTTRRYGGLGLGLSIAQHLVAAHGGSLRAESGGARGVTMILELPLERKLPV